MPRDGDDPGVVATGARQLAELLHHLVPGKPFEDESNKAATLVCRDARPTVAFTGLAEVGAFVNPAVVT